MTHIIVNGIGKTLRQHSVVVENNWVDAGIKLERINICNQRVQEIASQTNFSCLIELETFGKILLCFIKDLNSHVDSERIRAFDSDHS